MKKYRLRLLVYVTLIVIIMGVIAGSCFSTWQKIYENKKTKEHLEEQYNNLVEKEETLEGEVVKLQDPEYVAKYAREKFLYSKDGELIIDLSDHEDEEE